jgi:hypothetical protein
MEYHARCHCKRVCFSFRSPEITAGIHCNCPLCVRRSAVLSPTYILDGDFTPHADERDLTVYLWNDKVMRHYFCETCGIAPYSAVAGDDGKDRYRVNLGCVEGIDALALDITIVDGKAPPLSDAPRVP